MDYDKATLDDLSDMNYRIQAEELTRRAFPKPEKDVVYTNKIGKEMMENYGKLYNRPIIRPGPDGRPTEYKFNNLIDLPELDDINKYTILENELMSKAKDAHMAVLELEETSKEVERKRKSRYIHLNVKLSEQIKKITKEIKGEINKNKEPLSELRILMQKTNKKEERDAIYQDIKHYQTNISRLELKYDEITSRMHEEYTRDLEATEKAIDDYQREIQDKIYELKDTVDTEGLQAFDEVVSKKTKALEENKVKVDKYKELLNTMNSGAFKSEREVGETDEEYLVRLNNTAQTPYQDQQLFLATMDNLEQLKKNFKDITRNNVLIEAVVNALSPNDRYLVNKFWAQIRKILLTTYGYNNKSTETDDIIAVIDKFLSSKEQLIGEIQPRRDLEGDIEEELGGRPSKVEIEERLDPSVLLPSEDFEVFKIPSFEPKETNLLTITTGIKNRNIKLHSEVNQKDYFIKIALIIGPQTLHYVVLGSSVDQSSNPTEARNGLYRVIKFSGEISKSGKESIQEIANYMNVPVEILGREVFGSSNPTHKSAYEHLRSEYRLTSSARNVSRIEGSVNKNVEGWGVHNAVPKVAVFGKVKILLDKLYTKNILSVKDKKGHNIHGFTTQKITDAFIHLIQKIFRGEKIDKYDLNILSTHEKEIFDNLLFLSGLSVSHEIPNNKEEHIKRIKDRIELVEGQIEAGNNNFDLLKELKGLLLKLVQYNVISTLDAKKHIAIIENDYFN